MEWLCSPILDTDNQSNIFLGLKSIDYPEAYIIWFHSWIERLFGDIADSSPDSGGSFSKIFYFVATLQFLWRLFNGRLSFIYCFWLPVFSITKQIQEY